MIVADTSVWIEYLKQNPAFTNQFRALLEDHHIVTIEPIFAELLYGIRKPADRNIVTSYWQLLPRLDYTPGSMLGAAQYANENNYHNLGVGLMDALIIKPTIEKGYQLWTLDKRILRILPEENNYS